MAAAAARRECARAAPPRPHADRALAPRNAPQTCATPARAHRVGVSVS